jgi:hypothetical protein
MTKELEKVQHRLLGVLAKCFTEKLLSESDFEQLHEAISNEVEHMENQKKLEETLQVMQRIAEGSPFEGLLESIRMSTTNRTIN